MASKSMTVPMQEPCDAELRYYLKSICSVPCPVTLETATAYYVERAKLNRISRCIKVLNKQSETGEYESEEGVANLPRVQRRYLLRSMESGIRRSQANHMLFFNAIREEVTPSGGKPDAYFQDLLFQFYTEKAEEAANELLAKWSDPVVKALENAEEEVRKVTVKQSSAVVEKAPKRPEIKRDSTRSPVPFSDEESGSEKAASGDEFGTDDDSM